MVNNMPKKTIKVEILREKINRMVAGEYGDKPYREGLLFLLADVLYGTGNYRGYRYLESHEVPEGQLPGIRRSSDGSFDTDWCFDDTDTSRVHYH